MRRRLLQNIYIPLTKSLVVDLTLDKRVNLAELLVNVPDKTYNTVDEVAEALEEVI